MKNNALGVIKVDGVTITTEPPILWGYHIVDGKLTIIIEEDKEIEKEQD